MPRASADARPVALTGMMAAGKSTVAAHLGRLLARPVISTDAEVERRAGKPIARIFAEEGEAAFRALEREVLSSLTGPAVVDLGGGAFCDPQGGPRLLASAIVVFLEISAAEAARRLGAAEGRPLAGRWEALLAERLPLYRRAHHAVQVDGLAPEEVARRIVELVGAASSPPRGERGDDPGGA